MPDTSLSVTKYVAFSPYIKKFCDTSLVSYNLIPLWYYVPSDSLRPHRLRAQFHKSALSPPFSCHCWPQVLIYAAGQQAIGLEIWKAPVTLSFSSTNLLERLRKLKETPMFASSSMDINKNTPTYSQMKRHTGQGLGGSQVQELLSSWSWDVSTSHVDVVTNLEAPKSPTIGISWKFPHMCMIHC